jgi:hypothetical protein
MKSLPFALLGCLQAQAALARGLVLGCHCADRIQKIAQSGKSLIGCSRAIDFDLLANAAFEVWAAAGHYPIIIQFP